jgi:UTP--glucose-1-phosphate uridylyltransferase
MKFFDLNGGIMKKRLFALASLTVIVSLATFGAFTHYRNESTDIHKKGIDMTVRKVVIPAAGYGTRFLPITKSIPKEMLPVLNRPALHEVVEESVKSGIHHFCLIMNNNKPEIKDYFTPDPAFREMLAQTGKEHFVKELNELLAQTTFEYIKQPEMLGLGHAILMARPSIQNELFGVLLPDMVIFGQEPCMKPLVEAAQEHKAAVIAVMEVPWEEISSYGSIKIGKKYNDNLMEIDALVEKPKREDAYSNLAVLGRYVFTPDIFDAIEETAPQAVGEIQLTDAINLLIQKGHKVLAYKVDAPIFDLGRPQGWLAANIYAGMQSTEIGPEVKKILQNFLS